MLSHKMHLTLRSLTLLMGFALWGYYNIVEGILPADSSNAELPLTTEVGYSPISVLLIERLKQNVIAILCLIFETIDVVEDGVQEARILALGLCLERFIVYLYITTFGVRIFLTRDMTHECYNRNGEHLKKLAFIRIYYFCLFASITESI